MTFLKYVKDKENMCRLRDSHKIRQKKENTFLPCDSPEIRQRRKQICFGCAALLRYICDI